MRWCLSLCLLIACATRQPASESLLPVKAASIPHRDRGIERIVRGWSPFLDSLLSRDESLKINIIYTQIDTRADGKKTFTHRTYFSDGGYFYPASTVKLPVALLALQRMKELGIDPESTMITGTAAPVQTAVYNDPASFDGRPSVANYVRKIFLVSDNDAYNRLYEFLGQEYINNSLHRMGYDSVQILHRLSVSLTEEQNRQVNPVSFYDTSGRLLYTQASSSSKLVYQPRSQRLGNGYMSGGKLKQEPFDFSKKNRILLSELQQILISVIYPESVGEQSRFNIRDSDYFLVRKYLSMKPGESQRVRYGPQYDEAYSKLLMYGGKGKMEKGIRIFNKEGDAYGFLTDIAYITDTINRIEFFLSASIYCNSDGIFNDDRYDYTTVGFPFLRELGQAFYAHERARKRKHLPDLSFLLFNYTDAAE